MELIVTASDNLSLYAGAVTTQADILFIHPPEPSLFDQLCTWLDQCPPPAIGFNHWVLAIGATALCLRWGTYLAVLMDEAKPVDPRARHLTTSMVSQEEMRRINIEASSNLARLLQLWHHDEDTFFGPIEDSHAGRGATYSLRHRRFTARQARQVIRYTAERLSPFVSDFPLWGDYLADVAPWPARIGALPAFSWYPRDWSLTESSSQIQLKQEWTV